MADPNSLPVSMQLKHEQESLRREITEWREWWKELSEMGKPHFGEMGMRLSKIRDTLSQHFQHEEQGQCFPEIIREDSSKVREVEQLTLEHGELLEELDRVIERVGSCGDDDLCWGDARDLCEAFLLRLEGHEDKENALIESCREILNRKGLT